MWDRFNLRRRDFVVAAGGLMAGSAWATHYPERPVKLLLTVSPGSAVDAIARAVAPHMATALGQPVVIENRPGSSGLIATAQMVRSPADGYTLCMTSSSHCIFPHLHPKMPYDALKDVQPICVMTSGPSMLVVNPSLPAADLAQFIALAKSRSSTRPVTAGSAGSGTTNQLAIALLEMRAGIKLIHTPYKTSSNYVQDLVGNHIDAGFLPIVVAQPLVQAGRLRAIAVSTAKRSSAVPNLPTVAESGIPGFDMDGWLALMGPAGIPTPIAERVSTEVIKALKQPDVAKYVTESGGSVVASSIKEAERLFRREFDDAAEIIRTAGIKPE